MQSKRENNIESQDLKNQKEEAPLINWFALFFKDIVIARIKILFSSICLEGPIILTNVALSQPKYVVVTGDSMKPANLSYWLHWAENHA